MFSFAITIAPYVSWDNNKTLPPVVRYQANHPLNALPMQCNIDKHLASPAVSLDEHVRQSQIALARTLDPRQAIYLDVKFWIIVRNALTGTCSAANQHELLRLLRELVASGKAFCPISESTFAELFKQRDAQTRRATAQLIDELSLGVALIPFDARVMLELQNFIYTSGGQKNLPPLQQLLWSKLSYVLGWVHPAQTGFDIETELAVQKAFFDHMWTIPMSEMVQIIGDQLPPDERCFQSLATRLNAGNAQHATELRSFEQTYAIEIKGVVDLFAADAAGIVCDLAQPTTHMSMPREGAEWVEYVREWRSFLIAAFKKNEVKDALRTLHINTCLHASVRWNKGQQLEANDFYDFHHATAALGYCDVFLTERPLLSMVTAKNIALDKRYACRVVADVDDALNLLHSLR